VGGFPADICRKGYQLLCRSVGDDQLAHFPQGSRYLVPYPGTWLAQVWYPLLVSGLTLITVGLSRRDNSLSQ